MTFPTIICEFSPGTAPFGTPSWVDLSSRVLNAEWSFGRSDELATFGPSQATVVLRNDDRLLDPEHTTGTYFGQLNPRVPFRLRATHSAVTYDLFYGFVEDGFEQGYMPPDWATCTVRLVDLYGVVEGALLPQSAYVNEVLVDSPAAFWKLDESSGTVMRDSSGHGYHGFYDNPTLGQDSLVVDEDGHSIDVVHVGEARGEFRGEGLPTAAPVSLEAWVKFPRDLTQLHTILMVQRDAVLGSRLTLAVETSGNGSPNGELTIRFVGLGGSYTARGHMPVDDDDVHHVAMTMASTAAADIKLYVDGVEQTKTVVSGTTGGSWAGHLWWTVGNTTSNGYGDFGLGGLIDEAAVYPSALSAARILAHYQAGSSAFDAETSGTRLGRVLDIVGVPAGSRDIAAGDTTVGPADYSAVTGAGQYLDRVVESEQGYLWVDHSTAGKLTFRGRYSRLTEARSTAVQATFTDDPGALPANTFPYTEVERDPNGIASIVNTVQVTWRGGVEIVKDATSIGLYGPQSRAITTEAPSPVAAASAGDWLIRRYANPQVRVRRLVLHPGANQEQFPKVLDLRVGDRVVVERHPQLVGTQIANSLIIEGGKHAYRPGDWRTTYHLSDADDSDVWIWGTSTWGQTTTWG